MRKKIAVTAIIAIAAVVATLLVAQPIMSQEDTAPADIMDDANVNAVLSDILAGQGEVEVEDVNDILNEILAGQEEVSSSLNGVLIPGKPHQMSPERIHGYPISQVAQQLQK